MRALVIIDLQNDFLPNGALPVLNGNAVIPLINELQKKFRHIVATLDWHPKNHGSFASTHNKKVGEIVNLQGEEQILWPDHCIENTYGAEFAEGLDTSRINKVFKCGQDPDVDSYSGFLDNAKKRASGLDLYLKKKGIDTLYVVGLATDYCVLHTVLDGLDLGFNVFLVSDCTKGVELNKGDREKAIHSMKAKGAQVITSNQIVKENLAIVSPFSK